MKQAAIVGIVLSGTLAGTAWAQAPAAVIIHDAGQAAPMPVPGSTIDRDIGMVAVEPFEMGDPVENAPYSAEIVNEVTQELPNGNRIERRTTGTVARDSRGRVRREQPLAAIGPIVPSGEMRIITISDPVARVHYSLDPVRKSAIRSYPPRVIQAYPGPMMPNQGSARGPGLAVPSSAGGLDVRTEPLGTKDYEGVRVEGTRTIATLPAGTVGNLDPIEILSERWFSTELKVVVFSRRADPRFGETVYRLTNITRAEPDASLFRVPADYKREDVKPLPFEPPTEPLVEKPLR
jgi:hypothetical protein